MNDKKTHRDIQQAPKQTDGASGEQVNFEKAQGFSRNDEADLREVARKAAKKSNSGITSVTCRRAGPAYK
jgi:hypothetical protein